MKYTKKPVEIEAKEFSGENYYEITRWAHEYRPPEANAIIRVCDGYLEIRTEEGTMIASKGDMIIKGVKGEFYPCKPDIFALTYDKVE